MAHPGAGVLIEGRARGKRLRYNLKLLYAGLNASAVLRTSAVVRGAAHCKPRDARYRPSLWCVPVPTRGTAQAHCSASVWLPKSISGDAALSCFVRQHECVAADAAQRRFACLEIGCAETVPTVCGGPQFSLEKRVFRAERDQIFLGGCAPDPHVGHATHKS